MPNLPNLPNATRDDRPQLVLWDIDKTLVEVSGFGQTAYAEAFTRVTGEPFTMKFTFGGLTELAMIHKVLGHHGMPAEDELVAALFEQLAEVHRESIDHLTARGRLLPGAAEAVQAVDSLPGVRQTVLTGNMRSIGELKINLFGLEKWLDLSIGAFGDEDLERPDLLPRAWRNTEATYGETYAASQTVVIGDTVRDMEVATRHGAFGVGVGSGRESTQALADAGADVALDGLGDVEALLSAIRLARGRTASGSGR